MPGRSPTLRAIAVHCPLGFSSLESHRGQSPAILRVADFSSLSFFCINTAARGSLRYQELHYVMERERIHLQVVQVIGGNYGSR